ncbi:NrfD/PsrC family molybdoenzyme membrane anchor subunit [Planctomycetota bacterium]
MDNGHLNWGLPLIIDLFAAGMGAGAYLVAVAADLASKKKKLRDVSLAGSFIAPWPAIIGVLLLVIDLGNPQRFWEMILNRGDGVLTLNAPFVMFAPSSVMSWGTWVLSLFIIVSLCYFAAHIASFALHWVAPIRKIIGVIGLFFAIPVMVYTGVLISSCNNPLWNSFWLPTLFVVSAVATGVAAIIFVLSAWRLFLSPTEPQEPNVERLEKANSMLLIAQAVVLVLFMIGTLMAGSQGMKNILGLPFIYLFWPGIVGLGLVLPIITGLKGRLKPEMSFIISACVMLGGFFLRYVILIAGQTV